MGGTWREVALVGSAVLLTLAAERTIFADSAPRTTSGRPKKRDEKAFVLTVSLTFRSATAAKELMAEWAKIADYCYRYESFLYQYEFLK